MKNGHAACRSSSRVALLGAVRLKPELPLKAISLVLIASAGWSPAGEVKDITYKNSCDGTEQQAELFIPSSYDGKKPLPILAISHFMGGGKSSSRGAGHHDMGEKYGWFVVCPELHGQHTSGKTSLAAIVAQHDVIDAIHYAQEHYKIDETRIYAAGRSMGGMQTLILAAKYPHVFAAAMAGQPPTEMALFDKESPLTDVILKEFGGTRAEKPYEYARRGPATYARNLKYTPTFIWHGTLDRVVPPEHSKKMIDLMRQFNPYQKPVYWLEGAGHNPLNYGAEWIFDKLRWYQKTRYRFYPDLDFILDESGQFLWVNVEQSAEGVFSEVQTKLAEGKLIVTTKKVKRLKLNLRGFRAPKPKEVEISSDGALEVEVETAEASCVVQANGPKMTISIE